MNNIGNAVVMLIVGLLIAAGGACVAMFLAIDCEFTCARLNADQGSCQLIEKKLTGNETKDIQLTNIQNAEVQKSCHTETRSNKSKKRASSTRTSCTYSVVLNLKDGNKIAISGPGGSNTTDKPDTYANQVNSFINDYKQTDLKAEYNEAQTVYTIAFSIMGFGGLFCLIGIFMLLKGILF